MKKKKVGFFFVHFWETGFARIPSLLFSLISVAYGDYICVDNVYIANVIG